MAAFEFRPPPQPFVADPSAEYWATDPRAAPIWRWMFDYVRSYCLHISNAPQESVNKVGRILQARVCRRIRRGVAFDEGEHCANAEQGFKAYLRRNAYLELFRARQPEVRRHPRFVPIDDVLVATPSTVESAPAESKEAEALARGTMLALKLVLNAILFFEGKAKSGEVVALRQYWIVQVWARQAMKYDALLALARQHEDSAFRACWIDATNESLRAAMSRGFDAFVENWNNRSAPPFISIADVHEALEVSQGFFAAQRKGNHATAR